MNNSHQSHTQSSTGTRRSGTYGTRRSIIDRQMRKKKFLQEKKQKSKARSKDRSRERYEKRDVHANELVITMEQLDGVEWTLYDYEMEQNLKLWKSYRWLKKVAEKKGIKIFNATDGGYLDVFERIQFEQIPELNK